MKVWCVELQLSLADTSKDRQGQEYINYNMRLFASINLCVSTLSGVQYQFSKALVDAFVTKWQLLAVLQFNHLHNDRPTTCKL